MARELSAEEFLDELKNQRGIVISRATLLRYLNAGRIKGAAIGRDETGIRRVWKIPFSAVQSFELAKRGNPNLQVLKHKS